MKKFLVILLALSFYPVYSQSDTLNAKHKDSINLFLLNDISAGYNFYLSKNSALNISADIYGFFNFDDNKSKYSTFTNSDTTITKFSDDYIDFNQDFTLYILYKYFFYDDFDLKGYFAVGPLFGFDYRKYKNNSESFTITNKALSLFTGLSINPGIEYSLTEKFSLIAEYRINVSHRWISEEYISKESSKRITENDIKRLSIVIQGIRIGIGFKI